MKKQINQKQIAKQFKQFHGIVINAYVYQMYGSCLQLELNGSLSNVACYPVTFEIKRIWTNGEVVKIESDSFPPFTVYYSTFINFLNKER